MNRSRSTLPELGYLSKIIPTTAFHTVLFMFIPITIGILGYKYYITGKPHPPML